ncbi:hypothetical protein [Alteromonas mediterranea]|uniref:hypothetical protein n=1 Tax=Alteromonas mediterranea TaxID=314275 RepID=UPI0012DB6577|nr:hypothetical protein [Alteromonas mediterranea]
MMFDILVSKKQLVISQTDIDEAMIHLNSLPHTITKQMPKAWGQEQFIQWLTESLPKTVNVGDSFSVATGIYGHVLPVGYEYLNAPKDDRLQIALSIRKWQADMDRLVEIKR